MHVSWVIWPASFEPSLTRSFAPRLDCCVAATASRPLSSPMLFADCAGNSRPAQRSFIPSESHLNLDGLSFAPFRARLCRAHAVVPSESPG